MKQIATGIYQWSVFNKEKGLDFNGLYLQTKNGAILVDPPEMTSEDQAEVDTLGAPLFIYLTNKHHTRAAAEFRKHWGAKVFVSEDDAALMEIPVDGTYADGELLMDEIEAINLPDAKTPGECAFHWPARRILILGDAIISKTDGLAMLPDEKFKDPSLARLGLKVLKGLDYDCLLVGDGAALTNNANVQVEDFIDRVNVS